MEHRVIHQWLIERQRELSRNRIAQTARRTAQARELAVDWPDDESPAAGAPASPSAAQEREARRPPAGPASGRAGPSPSTS